MMNAWNRVTGTIKDSVFSVFEKAADLIDVVRKSCTLSGVSRGSGWYFLRFSVNLMIV